MKEHKNFIKYLDEILFKAEYARVRRLAGYKARSSLRLVSRKKGADAMDRDFFLKYQMYHNMGIIYKNRIWFFCFNF